MTCCNHNCRQGRDCPNRRERASAITDAAITGLALMALVLLIALGPKMAINAEHEITNVEREW